MSVVDEEDAELARLRTELEAVQAEFGVTVTSAFPGTNPDATEHDRLRAIIDSLRVIGEEIRNGTLEVVTEYED